jgi:hypothetical protein
MIPESFDQKFIDRYTTKKEQLERRTLVGPMDDGKEVMAALHNCNWRIIRSGPYTDRKMFPACDDTRFQFIAEKIT